MVAMTQSRKTAGTLTRPHVAGALGVAAAGVAVVDVAVAAVAEGAETVQSGARLRSRQR